MPGALKIEDFGRADALARVGDARPQVRYLRCYFAGLNAASVLEEPFYFDRDYLSEFQAFYGVSAREYPNRCKRLHFFSERLTRERVVAAACGDPQAQADLQRTYLGFVVVRPIPAAPLGRTVACWYPDADAFTTPRVVTPAREYRCNIAGFTLKVRGLAWQQQDSAVGACATVALWSMLHSSAFDDTHAIPTTADITRFAHRTASLGSRVFPSNGLSLHQMLEAIKEAGLAPVVLEGDIKAPGEPMFTRERFASSCASLIRSGYPVILVGSQGGGGHAICAVGFRESAASLPSSGAIELQDAKVQRLYVHDDNIGPNARFEITDSQGAVALARAAPKQWGHAWPDPTHPWPAFTPHYIVAAVHDGLRTSPDVLHAVGLRAADAFSRAIVHSGLAQGVTLSTRFIRLPAYHEELASRLAGAPAALGNARMGLAENAPPMSLHVGLVRIGNGATPHLDILYDTTDSDRNVHPFCHVLYSVGADRFSQAMHGAGWVDWGAPIRGF